MGEKPKELLVAQELMDRGEYREASQLLNDFEEKGELTNEDLHSYYFLKSSLLFERRNFKEAQKFARLACKESQKIGEDIKIVESLILMAKVLVRQPKECLDVVVKAENLLKTISPELISNLKQKDASLSWIKGWAYFYGGDSIKSLKFAERSLKLREELGNKKGIILSLINLGYIYTLYNGDLKRSLILSERALNLAEEIGIRSCHFEIALIMANLGNIFGLKGELSKTLDYYEQALAIFEEFEYKGMINSTLHNIALIHWQQGDIDKAREMFEKGYMFNAEYGNPWTNSIYLGNLVELNIEMGDLEKANLYLRKLKALKNQEENEFINNMYSACKAITFKKSTKVGDQAKAEELYKQLIKEDRSSLIEVRIDALINLCDLLLVKLNKTNNLKLIDEIQLYTTQIHDLAKNQHSFLLLAENFLLQSKLQLLIFELKEAQHSLAQALHISEKHELNRLTVRITREQDELTNKLNKWEELKKSEAELSLRMDLVGLDDQVRRLLRKRSSLVRSV